MQSHIIVSMPTDLIPSAEVCDRLQIDRSTLTRWVQAGKAEAQLKLPGLHGAYLFATDEVARLEESRRHG